MHMLPLMVLAGGGVLQSSQMSQKLNPVYMKKYPYLQKNPHAFWRFRAFEDIGQFSFSFCQAEVIDRRAVNVREFPWFQIENRFTNKKVIAFRLTRLWPTLLLQV